MEVPHHKAALSWPGAFALCVSFWLSSALLLRLSAVVYALLAEIPMATAFSEMRQDVLTVVMIQSLSMALVYLFCVRWIFNETLSAMARAAPLRRPTVLEICLTILAATALQFALSEVSNLARQILDLPFDADPAARYAFARNDFADSLRYFIALALLPAISEELFFRGLIMGALRRRYAPIVAVLVSAFLFALSHQQTLALIYAFLAGVVFALSVMYTGSLYIAMLMHGIVNLIPLLLPESVIRIPGFNIPAKEVLHLNWQMTCASFALLALSLWGLWAYGRSALLRERAYSRSTS